MRAGLQVLWLGLSLRVQPLAHPGSKCVTSATEHSRILFAAILPGRRDLLDIALRDLNANQIPDLVLRNMFTMLERYNEVTGQVMTAAALADMLSGSRLDAGTTAAYVELYDELAAKPADEAAFRWSLSQIRELAAERTTKQAFAEGMEILTRGVTDERGERQEGHSDARAHVLTRLADIDAAVHGQAAPEGDVRNEGSDILAEYAAQEAARAAGRGQGIRFGVEGLDDKVGGLFPGELWLVVAFTSDGKTSLCVQAAWSAVVEQGKNVLFLTTETTRRQVRRRVIARHSCLPQFGGEGLNSRDLKLGTLNDTEKRRLHAVVDDFQNNSSYGQLYVCQVPRGSSMTYVENKSLRVSRDMKVDLLVMDYLALLRPERKRTTDREELSNTLKRAKEMSTTFNDGEGVPFMSPWQVSRSARIEAERVGYYKLDATSETAETSNSTDGMIGLLAPLDNESRSAKVKAQLMKHRDGQKANSIELSVDYATCRFTGGFQQGVTPEYEFDPIGSIL